MHPWGIKIVEVDRAKDRLLVMEFAKLGWGGNSGFHAINLAVQFGVRKIILVGYDMRLDKGMHWHGKHPSACNNPTDGNVARWRRAVDGMAPSLFALGIKVCNTSPISRLENYPQMTFEDALAC